MSDSDDGFRLGEFPRRRRRGSFWSILAIVVPLGALAFIIGVAAFNWSGFYAPPGDGATRLIAHRGVHHTFNTEDVENDTCTATRIYPPTHDFIENTIPSMEAAFAAGADIVEIDVHLTPGGRFAVMHDWTLDCRTDGTGVTHETDMATLRSLDVGYGYTADDGVTFPLRGKGVGLMPTLDEVFERFPNNRFLVNFKSRRAEEGDALAALIAAHPEWRDALWGVYGGDEPTDTARSRIAGLKGYTRARLVECVVSYMAIGWTGRTPPPCRDTIILVPANFTWAIWGWPHLFTRRMEKAGSTVILIGPLEGDDIGTRGLDSVDDMARIPARFSGYVWTNRIELIGPALAERR